MVSYDDEGEEILRPSTFVDPLDMRVPEEVPEELLVTCRDAPVPPEGPLAHPSPFCLVVYFCILSDNIGLVGMMMSSR